MAPAGTPQILREKVSADLRDLLAQPALTQKFATLGTYPRPLSPTEVADFIRQQRETWSPLVQKIGLLDR
jgi:tripartite-type tricarboxylate transporter receptor subunit TctC